MNYLKFTQYAYIFAGILFAVDAFTNWKSNESFILSAVFSAICIFMFFFRKKFSKKFDDRNQNKQE